MKAKDLLSILKICYTRDPNCKVETAQNDVILVEGNFGTLSNCSFKNYGAEIVGMSSSTEILIII